MLVFLKNINPLEKSIILIISFVALIDFLIGGLIFNYLSFNTEKIVNHFEFWRLFTYPLVVDNISGYVLFLITFSIYLPKIDLLFERKNFPLILFLIVMLQSIIFSLVFWEKSINIGSLINWTGNFELGGMEGVSVFILALFTLLNPNINIKISENTNLKGYAFTTFILSTWVLSKYFIYQGLNINLLYINIIATIGFGSSIALLIFGQLKIINKVINKEKPTVFPIKTEHEEFSHAYAGLREIKKPLSTYEADDWNEFMFEENYEFNYEKMNEILDKINDSGNDSLSPYEKKYLQEFSKRIK